MELDLYTREIPYDRRWFVNKVIFFISDSEDGEELAEPGEEKTHPAAAA